MRCSGIARKTSGRKNLMAISIHNPIRIRVCDEFLVIVRHVKSILPTLAAIVGAGAPCGVSTESHQAKRSG
jgi:hypothetical protein